MREIETGGGKGYTPPRKPKRTVSALDVLPAKKGGKPKGYTPPRARQVERKTQQQRTAAQHEVKDTKEDYLPEAKRKAIVDASTPLHIDMSTDAGRKLQAKMDKQRQDFERRRAASVAPVLTVLDQTTRPLHAVAAGTEAAIKGENVGRAAKRGLQNKDKTTFSKVLKELGAPKVVQSVGGFALDVGLDPTTYLTGGTAAVGKNAVRDAAEAAAKSAAKAGLTEEQAKRFADMAARQAAKTASEGPKGVTVKFAGHEVPGVRAATGHTIGRAARRAGQTRVGQGAKAIVGDVNPNLAPKGATRAESDAATSAARTARAQTGRVVVEAQNRAIAMRKALGEDDMQVVHAIETNTINKLPQHLHAPARELRDTYKHIRRVEKQAGVRGGTRSNYVPHYTNQSLAKGAPSESAAGGSAGRRVIRPSSSKARKAGTLQEKVAEKPGVYNTDAALAFANRLIEGGKSVAQANLNRRIADELGRPVRHGVEYDPAAEGVFLLKGSDLTEVTDHKLLAKIENGYKAQGGRYVILNRDLVKKAHGIANPGGDRGAIAKTFDKGTGTFKYVATVPNPGFHLRNLVGGTQNAYLAIPGHKLPGLLASSARDLSKLGKAEEARRTLGKAPVDSGDAARAAEVGGIRSGVLGAELHDLLKTDAVKTGRVRNAARKAGATGPGRAATRAGRALKRTGQNIEDLPRLAVYKHGKQMGMSDEEASRLANHYLFDYSNVTNFERGARRVAPFYTFSARNIPLQAKSLVTKPGKFANYQKAREEVQQATGTDPGYEGQLPNYEQRQAPFPVKIKGMPFTASIGLPLTDLNEVPTSLNPVKAGDEWLQRGISMVNPIFKDPIELWANYSTFFRGPIRTKDSPQVSAPDFVGSWPAWAKKAFNIKKMRDSRTGKMVWKWDAKANYVAHAIPGPAQAALNLSSTGTDRQGRGTPEKLAAYGGLKLTPTDAVTNQINQLYDKLDKLDTERGRLNKAGVSREDDIKRLALNLQSRKIEREIWQLSLKRGDKVLPKQGRPASSRGPSSSSGLGGGGLGGGLGAGGLGGGL